MLLLSSLALLAGISAPVLDAPAAPPSAALRRRPPPHQRLLRITPAAAPRQQLGPITRLYLDHQTWLFGHLAASPNVPSPVGLGAPGLVGIGRQLALDTDSELISELGLETDLEQIEHPITHLSAAYRQQLSTRAAVQAGLNTRVDGDLSSTLALTLWWDTANGIRLKVQHHTALDGDLGEAASPTSIALERRF